MAGVRPTLVARDDIGLRRKQVHDLALPLIAPQASYYNGYGHS
jgi:hypothetical protein